LTSCRPSPRPAPVTTNAPFFLLPDFTFPPLLKHSAKRSIHPNPVPMGLRSLQGRIKTRHHREIAAQVGELSVLSFEFGSGRQERGPEYHLGRVRKFHRIEPSRFGGEKVLQTRILLHPLGKLLLPAQAVVQKQFL